MDEYVSAQEAAAMLGVTVDTLYVYVSRKGIRSIPGRDSAKRLYWRADVERAGRRGRKTRPLVGQLETESAITLYTNVDLFYRGRSVRELIETATFEDVAALLWNVNAAETFTASLPAVPASLPSLLECLAGEAAVIKAMSLLPMLEGANPRSYDLSQEGMARTGADVLRWFCALTLGRVGPIAEPIHEVFGTALGLSGDDTDLVRRLLILSADHGLESACFAVRAVASTGVSPWRLVPTGLFVMSGQRSRVGHFGRVERLVAEVVESPSPADVVFRRIHEGEAFPGFQSADASHADARVKILRDHLHLTIASDRDFKNLEAAARAVQEVLGLEPTFSYYSRFIWRRVGLPFNESPFLLGRSAGWIAHAIEQHQVGERERVELYYRGPLPFGSHD